MEIQTIQQPVLPVENRYRELPATDGLLLLIGEGDDNYGIHAEENYCWQVSRTVFAGKRVLHSTVCVYTGRGVTRKMFPLPEPMESLFLVPV